MSSVSAGITTNRGLLALNLFDQNKTTTLATDLMDGGTFTPVVGKKYPINHRQYGPLVTVIILGEPEDTAEEKKENKTLLGTAEKAKDFVEFTINENQIPLLVIKNKINLGQKIVVLQEKELHITVVGKPLEIKKRYYTPQCFLQVSINGKTLIPLMKEDTAVPAIKKDIVAVTIDSDEPQRSSPLLETLPLSLALDKKLIILDL